MGFLTGWNRRRIQYRLTRKDHYVYLVHIPQDGVAKIGRTCRLKHRLHNLRQSLYRSHAVYVIACSCANESLRLEKYIMSKLPRKITGEWFSEATPADVQSLLINEWGHLLLVPYDAPNETEIPKANIITHTQNNFTITLI